MRCFSKRFVIDKFKNDTAFKSFVTLVNKDDTLSLEMNEDLFVLYKNGFALLEIKDKRDGKIYYKLSKNLAKNEKKSILLEKINQDELNGLSSNYFQDMSRKKESNDEKKFQYFLAKHLYLVKEDAYTFAIIPEYCQKTKVNFKEESLWRIDLVVVNFPLNERPYLTLVEIKRGDEAINNDNGIAKHLQDFKNIILDNIVMKTLCNDLELVFLQKIELGLIPNGQNYLSRIDIDYKKTNALVVMADLDEDNRNLAKEKEKIDWKEYESLPIEFTFVKSNDYNFEKYERIPIKTFSNVGFN